MPRSSRPALSPAMPSSNCFLNISTPVTTVLRVSRKPTISTSSPTFTLPRSIRPVTTVPRPEIEKISSIGIRNGLSSSRAGCGTLFVHRLHQRVNLLFPLLFPVQRAQSRQAHHRHVVARELVRLQQLAHFELNQIQQLGIVDRIALVQRDHDVRHTDLARQQHVLARLRHGTVGRRHHQNRAIHLRRARDHVLDVVGVARAIHVRVVPVRRLVLDVRRRDRDAARLLFRRVINRVERPEHNLRIVLLQHLGDRRRQRRLAVIDVTNRPYVAVRLIAIKFFFRHNSALALALSS